MSDICYVGVGSNIDPEKNLPEALRRVQQQARVEAVATVYRTAPIGRPDQADYANTVWRIRVEQPPKVVKFKILRPIEAALGRVRTADKYAARPIDLDLIAYGNLARHDADLTLPDPDIRTRPFLAVPLLELAPHYTFPDSGESLSQVISALDATDLAPMPTLTRQLQRMVHHE